jgi:hypothetical protein
MKERKLNMRQAELDVLRKGVHPEFWHLLGQVDEDEGMGLDEVEPEDTLQKTIEKTCNPPVPPNPIEYSVAHDLNEFVKSFMPTPQPGPHQPGPASPTRQPTGVPYPTRVDIPTRIPSPPKKRFLSLMNQLKGNANPDGWRSVMKSVRGMTTAVPGYQDLFNALDQNDLDGAGRHLDNVVGYLRGYVEAEVA